MLKNHHYFLLFSITLTAFPLHFNGQSCASGGTCVYTAPPTCSVDLGEPRTYKVFGCTAAVEASWDGLTPKTETASCIANPPLGYTLWSIDPPQVASNNGNFSVSRMTQGLEFHYEEEVENSYRDALDIAAKIADITERANVEAQIKSDWASHRKIVQNVKTNQDTVRIDVSASAHGAFFDRQRGWEQVTAFLLVRCAAPINLKDQLLDKYKLRPDLAKMQRSVIFKNTSPSHGYVAWKPVDRFQACDKANGTVSSLGLDASQQAELPIDISLSVCYLFGADMQVPDPKKFVPACRVKVGDTVNLGADHVCTY